jgi:hypothetical protein
MISEFSIVTTTDVHKINFSDEYKDWNFSIFTSKTSTGNSITAYCCVTDKAERFEKDWNSINSFIAAKYVSTLDGEYERWNSYLLFICEEKMSKSLQYEIENNKFSMRKIVVNNQRTSPDKSAVINILNDKILSENIDFKTAITVAYKKKNCELITPAYTELGKEFLALSIPSDAKSESTKSRDEWLKAKVEGHNNED